MPDFRIQPSFPIASVIDAAGRNAQLQEQAREAGNRSLIEGLQSIGQVGQSLYDTKKRVAQSLALGRQFDIPDDVAKTMDPAHILQVGAIKKGNVDMNMLLNLLHPGSGGTAPQVPTATAPTQEQPGAVAPRTPTNVPMSMSPKPEATLASASPTIPMPAHTEPAATMPFGGASIAPVQSPIPVPIQAPPVQPRTVNAATAKMAMAMRPVPVMTAADALSKGTVEKGTIIKDLPRTPIEVSERENQFYQREWDKLLKESDPLNASSRTPLGLASRANFQANRALKTLSSPVVTNQEAGNAMADIAAIYQNGSPTEFGMSHQAYNTLYGKVQGIVQQISGKPQDALPDPIKQRLLGVLSDMKGTNQALLKQRLDMTEKSKKSVISHFPDEWKDYRHILEGDQSQYNGMGTPSASSGKTLSTPKGTTYTVNP